MPLKEAILLKRYKRFLADIELENQIHTVHVPNTGSMTSCWAEGWKCAVSTSNNPNRKMPLTLELTWNGSTWIGVNTANANKVVNSWLHKELIPELKGYSLIQAEKKIGESRIDFYLEGHKELPPCYVEVKSVTLLHNELAMFPDSVSTRGQKHLKELMELKKQGLRAVMLFVVQREDTKAFSPAGHIDKIYGQLLSEAMAKGVEILCYQCEINLTEIKLGKKLPIQLK
jgi:sugar fermentation stimulation protein A